MPPRYAVAADAVDVRSTLSGEDHTLFHSWASALTVVLIMLAGVSKRLLGYTVGFSSPEVIAFPVLAAAAVYCWHARARRLLQSCLLMFWALTLGVLLQFPLYIAARFNAPLQDRTFADLDHWIGIEVPVILRAVARYPHIQLVLAHSYNLLWVLVLCAVLLPALLFRFRATKELIVGIAFGTLGASVLFAGLPAVGPRVFYGFATPGAQDRCVSLLMALRSGAPQVVPLDASAIACFRCLHVLWAVLACVAVCSLKWLRIPAIMLTIAVVLSALTTGSSYVVEALGALVLAGISAGVARVYTRMERHLAQAQFLDQ